MCHFLVESKPYERIDLLTIASINIYQTKKEKKVFQYSWKHAFRKKNLVKQFGKLSLSERNPSF